MSVKKRKNRKNWSANWRDIQGVQRQRTFKTQNEAKEFERQMLIQKNKGIQVNINQGKRPLQEFYEEWLISKTGNVRPKSLLQYENSWDVYMKPIFGQVPISKITNMDILKWISSLQLASGRKASGSTANRVLSILSMIFNWAVEADAILVNPIDKIKKGSNKNLLPRVKTNRIGQALSIEQLQKVANTCTETFPTGGQDNYRLFVLLMGLMGLRVGEAAGLRVKDLNFDDNRMTIEHTLVYYKGKMISSTTKNGKTRVLPISHFIVEDLKLAVQDKDPEDLVFLSYLGQPVNTSRFGTHLWKKALKRAGLPTDIRVHDLRHTAASLYINYGMSAVMVAELLGHSNPAITLNVYSHLYKGELARSMGDVEKKIAQELIRVNTETIQSETA
jgi:integrase